MTESQQATRALFVGRYPCRIVVRRHGSQWVACATLETADGPVRFAASADEDVIARGLAQHVASAGFDLGRVFGDVARSARQLAQSRATRDVMRTVSDVVREPVVADAVAFIPGVGPVASTAIRSASTLLDRSGRGDPRALGNIGRIATSARSGNPLAAQTMQVLSHVFGAQRRASAARFRERRPAGAAPSSTTPPAPSPSRPGGDIDLGGLLGSLFGAASSIASAASGTIGAPPAQPSAPRAQSADGWRDVRPEDRTPAQHRAAYEAAAGLGLGDAYQEAATVGAWEGARWLWTQLRPRTPFRSDAYDRRAGYADGLTALAERGAARTALPR